MSVNKVEDISYKCDDAGNTLLLIELNDLFKPYLIDVHCADRLVIWWTCTADTYSESMILYSCSDLGGETYMDKVNSWKQVQLSKAIDYMSENLV